MKYVVKVCGDLWDQSMILETVPDGYPRPWWGRGGTGPGGGRAGSYNFIRALKAAAIQNGFKFHPRFKDLQLCSSSFVDDPLLFYKADLEIVKCLMTAFIIFLLVLA